MVRFGTVKCFFSQEEKRYGFIKVDGAGAVDVYFRADNYCDGVGGNWLDREPKAGDRVAFKMDDKHRPNPKASRWVFEVDYRPRLNCEPLNLRLGHLPVIGHNQLRPDDVSVGSLEVSGVWGHGPRSTWIEIVLRTGTDELFQLPCWEGENGGDVPDLEVIRTPRNLSIEID